MSAVQFFADFTSSRPLFRVFVVQSIQLQLLPWLRVPEQPSSSEWDAVSWSIRSIGRMSGMPWVTSVLLAEDVCPVLIRLMLYVFLDNPVQIGLTTLIDPADMDVVYLCTFDVLSLSGRSFCY